MRIHSERWIPEYTAHLLDLLNLLGLLTDLERDSQADIVHEIANGSLVEFGELEAAGLPMPEDLRDPKWTPKGQTYFVEDALPF